MATWTQRWERVTRVPPDKAAAWWFDLREDDHAVHEYKDTLPKQGKDPGRRIVERAPDKVVGTDTYKDWTFPIVVRRKAHDRFEYELGEGKYVHRATLRTLPEAGGSRLIWEGTVEVRGLFGLLAPLFQKTTIREFQEDMDRHAAHMEREWREKPW